MATSFQAILENKLDEAVGHANFAQRLTREPFENQFWFSARRPALGGAAVYRRAQAAGVKGSQGNAKARDFTRAEPRERRVCLNELNAVEQRAHLRLRQLGAGLENEFSESELKAEWRKLARRFHPDSNGPERSAPCFMESLALHRALLKVFARAQATQ